MVLGSKETVSICKLCSQNKPLIRSHLIAKRIYSLVGTEQEAPIIINSRVIMHSSRQTKDFLLCRECDNLLSKNGENWIIPKLARQNGQFLLADHLQNFPPMPSRRISRSTELVKIHILMSRSSATLQWA